MTWLHEKGDPRSIRQARTAMRVHPCGSYLCKRQIRPGERYMLCVELPGGEAGYADSAGHPVQMKVCRHCWLYHGIPGRAEELGSSEDARSVVEGLIADWIDDGSFVTPADLAEDLIRALDGVR